MTKESTRQVGNDGEEKACLWLQKNGYEIVTRNWRTRRGEIDIIAEKGNLLVFAEVKTLPSGDVDTLSHELDERKQKRIVETAKLFLLNHRKYSNDTIRFDVLVVNMPGFSDVYHIEDAFSELV
ncbi:MAG: YraN family protein [Treponema sp.]|nr:YraN family protein [Treponema sp.]